MSFEVLVGLVLSALVISIISLIKLWGVWSEQKDISERLKGWLEYERQQAERHGDKGADNAH